jgi:membrane fusion protein, macrolide-specific efflux system
MIVAMRSWRRLAGVQGGPGAEDAGPGGRNARDGRRLTILINVALAVLAVGGGFWAFQVVHGGSQTAAADANQRTRMVPVTAGAVSQTVSASGSVASASTATANFVTSGTVTELDVKVGDPVTKGQVLAKVDATAVQAQLDTAKANRSAAYAAQTRAKDANADAATLASASAEVTSAEAAVTTAQQAVDGTVLVAPIAGTVTAVNGAVGSSSSSSSSGNSGASATGNSAAQNSSSSSSSSSGFIALADLTKMQVNAGFAEADATKLKAGQVADVTWSALTGARATGKVATIAPTATTSDNVNSYAVVISLDTLPAGVRIGQSTTAVVTVAEADNVLRIPAAALRTAGGQRAVEVSLNGQIELRTVEVGVQGNDFVEITSGLNEGDVVVITTTVSTSTTGPNGRTGNLPGGGGFFGGNGGAGAGARRGGGN